MPFSTQERRSQGLDPFHSQDEVFHGARILVNTAFGFEYPHGLASLVEMTGPLLPPRVARALSTPPSRPSQPPTSAERQPAPGSNDGRKPPPQPPQLVEGIEGDDEDPLALPFVIRTWLGGTGSLVAPGTAAFEAATKQAASAKQRADASAPAAIAGAEKDGAGTRYLTATAVTTDDASLPDDNGVIYVNLGRMPQLDKWQLVTVLQALSSTAGAMCWGGGSGEDRLGRYRVLWVLPREQRELLLSALLPMAPPPSFRLKILGGLPHLGVSRDIVVNSGNRL